MLLGWTFWKIAAECHVQTNVYTKHIFCLSIIFLYKNVQYCSQKMSQTNIISWLSCNLFSSTMQSRRKRRELDGPAGQGGHWQNTFLHQILFFLNYLLVQQAPCISISFPHACNIFSEDVKSCFVSFSVCWSTRSKQKYIQSHFIKIWQKQNFFNFSLQKRSF